MIRRTLFVLGVVPVAIAALFLWIVKGGEAGADLIERFGRWGR